MCPKELRVIVNIRYQSENTVDPIDNVNQRQRLITNQAPEQTSNERKVKHRCTILTVLLEVFMNT